MSDIRNELTKKLDRLTELRDQARVQLHLASLDAKQEWDERLEPKILEVEGKARGALGESSRAAVDELVGRVETFLARLSGKSSTPHS